MKRLAIFVHYSRDGQVCPNAMLYVSELVKHFDHVVISSNIMMNVNIEKTTCLCFEKNGYDFGYFYQAAQAVNAYENYDVIGLFNDSNYVVRPMDAFLIWCLENDMEMCGITDSHGYLPKLKKKYPDQYHVQSHFMVFKGNAVKLLNDYFGTFNANTEIFNETNIDTKRYNTIVYFEILLSVYMRNAGVKMGAYYSASDFIKTVSPTAKPDWNMHMILWKELLDYGYPMVKRKLINKGFSSEELGCLNNLKEMTHMDTSMPYVLQNCDINYTKTI